MTGGAAGRFAGRTVVVTGAGTGLGAAIAVRAAAEGARVGVHYRRSSAGAASTVRRISDAGGSAVLLKADIARWDEVTALASAAWSALGRVDVLVNNAGTPIPEQRSWTELTPSSLDRVIDTDLKGTLICVHEFGRRMVDQGGGAIVNVGSAVVVRGSARAPQYAAAKAGLLGVTKSYAHALAPSVRVNLFAPGFVATPSTLSRPEWAEREPTLLASTPLERVATAEEMAGLALFLASDDAAHLTGTFLAADGGLSMLGT
ncbi:SDR family NAD(P)-dependent oxidoreductase [Jiangella mangrovi]|uniref:3-oxoacyl-[acyl-carrier protein] reductase n=1 Tax=Jiangella mangrovi TaxID=1524084 RepID=A0A7W9LKA8_9ACTN|nr:SDR family oxidoreductase [Jiangella mangrovi]MBB5786943.1 3-oxoacyl-[acyl-carrier protein] reductase [Jiangella mangrovi]